MKMQLFARGPKCGGFGARGLMGLLPTAGTANTLCARNDESATAPIPPAAVVKNSRRVSLRCSWIGSISSFSRDQLIQIQNRPRHYTQRRGFGRRKISQGRFAGNIYRRLRRVKVNPAHFAEQFLQISRL